MGLQHPHGFADGRPTDPKLSGQIAFGRQLFADFQSMLEDPALDVIKNQLIGVRPLAGLGSRHVTHCDRTECDSLAVPS